MRKVLPFFLGIFLVVVVGAYWVLNYTGSNKDLATGSPYLITVEPGMTTADIANLLHKQKLVKTPEAFRLEAKFRGLERDLQAGRYEITAGMSNSEIVEVLSKGQVQRVRFTVPEGFTVVKTAKKIEAEGLGSAEKFIEAARNYTPYPYMETSDSNVIYKAEGFIFPSTYMFDIGMNEKDMLAMMVKEFNTQMNKENIPEEADIVKTIFDLYVETDSLTLTEAALIKQGFKTKNGKYFTRFSVKAILQNPVYMVADQEAYDFFIKNDTDLFSEHDAFDGVHGMMAYNRTDQEKGRASISLPPSEWIVSVGKHPGLIPGKVWVQVQESLERNKSKSFRKPRSNEALLTGLLFCSCGERMYPKMSKRKTADGKVIYTYVCKMKERSQRTVCNSKNANGNTLDMAIIEQVKMLADDKETFVSQLEQSRKFYTGNRMDYEQRISDMRKEKAETEKKINSLVDSLVEMGDSPAKAHVTKRIEQLNEEYQSLEKRIQELEGLTTQHALSDVEFDLMRQLLTVFKDGIDEMTIEQKRAAIRTIVRKVIWDGVNAHVVLFGVQDDEIEYPEIASAASDNTDDEDDNDELVAFSDVDYEDDDTEDDRLGKTNPLSASKTHWGEDSK